MKKKNVLLILSTILCVNLHAQDVPNVANFMPTPDDYLSMQYINDYTQYTWGKSVRSTSAGTTAASDMKMDFEELLSAFSNIVGIQLSETQTPYIYDVVKYCHKYADKSIKATRTSYYRQRPYARFSESSLVSDLDDANREVSSYPSAQATYGWLVALLLVEVCPELQNEILVRGYEIGNSAVIAGHSWYSDTQAGRDVASSLMIFFHTQGGFNDLMTLARNEYLKKAGTRAATRASSYLDYEALPNPIKYLPEPPEDLSVSFAYDIRNYYEGMEERYTSRGSTAKKDCNAEMDYISSIFSDAFGKTISESNTPEILTLITRVRDLASSSTKLAKDYYMRQRPYDRFKESSILPEEEDYLRDNGSYPSGHACFGWLIGMALAEINPANLDAIMNRAYEYGRSRIIAGYHWQSDVDAGRLAAGASYARLHVEEEFRDQMKKAISEFKGSTGIRGTRTDDGDSSAPVYTIGGVRLDGEPTQHGVYIQGNKKVAY